MTSSTWIRRLRPAASGTAQLLCFPHAGGAVNAYGGLARALDPGAEVFAVQYPARQDRLGEPPARDFGEIVERVLAELPGHRDPGRPLALFGHSMGALLAFETARALQRAGAADRPVHLFLSGRASPSLGPRASDFQEGDAALLAEIRRLGGMDPRLLSEPGILDLIMPPVRADYRLLGQYVWDRGTLRDLPVTVLVGEDDPIVSVDQADQWRGLTSGPGRTLALPGGHFFLDQQIERVAAAVTEALDGAPAEPSAAGDPAGQGRPQSR
ncbi:alpha/beta fold hydrolase [Streptomyces sp. NPDC052077]|uniref:thioesterase II family protein n=1 Tax=Streptomyces sp. NPDC052077 TaxID=3154757 RepID=UPI00342CF4BE